MEPLRCSIVIPVHNKAALTRRCLDSILGAPPETAFEIVVVDDGSTDFTAELVRGYGATVRAVRLETNAGFANACNEGATAAASPEQILFLNNDTVVTEGWLDALLGYAEAHPRAAVVGGKLLFPDDTIQHAGVAFSLSGDPLHIYAGFEAGHPAVNKSRRFQAVTAACALVRRAAFEQVGGFDTAFHDDLEDVDLCLRLAELGHETHYCHASVVYHLESVSRGSAGASRSAAIYRSRWGHRVRHDELDYYLEDGMLELLRSAPDRVGGSARSDDAHLIQLRSQQLLGLLREHIRLEAAGERVERSGPGREPTTQLERFRDGLAARRDGAPTAGGAPDVPEPEYRSLLRRLPELVNLAVPVDATVLVVSRGDDALLRLGGRDAWHFPRAASGKYAGSHPPDSAAAISHLEELRSQGAEYLLLPGTSLWWLDHYRELDRHLRSRYPVVAEEAGTCVVFKLAGSAPS